MRSITNPIRPTRVALVLAAALALTAGSGLPASASATSPSTSELPMTVGGFDADVAAANGYRIETAADGTRRSVPVTPEAKVRERSLIADSPTRNTVGGSCGTATLTVSKNLSRGGINVQTSYRVVGRSLGHVWNVSGASGLGAAFTEHFSGTNFSSSWSAKHFKSLYGAGAGGFGQIVVGSFAQMANGTICYAGRATHTWK